MEAKPNEASRHAVKLKTISSDEFKANHHSTWTDVKRTKLLERSNHPKGEKEPNNIFESIHGD
uniref:Uncharacterized protein n=1 Tax=Arundo donax TaxID=35708 RepID=A0A0A8Z124_ARUDO